MSLDVLTAIWRDPPCKGGDLLCLLAIADNADEFGYAWPSVETIARKAAMSERGAQKCLAKLSEAGLVTVEIGGGRGKSNAYQITTNGIGETASHKKGEQNSPNTVHPLKGINPEQSDINPEQSCNKPRTPVHPNSKEPSYEQSEVIVKPLDLLRDWATDEAVDSFSAYRKRIKKPITLTAAKRQASQLHEIFNSGGDPSDALGMAEERGWQSVQAAWYFNAIGDKNGSRSKQHSQPDSTLESISRAARSR